MERRHLLPLHCKCNRSPQMEHATFDKKKNLKNALKYLHAVQVVLVQNQEHIHTVKEKKKGRTVTHLEQG